MWSCLMFISEIGWGWGWGWEQRVGVDSIIAKMGPFTYLADLVRSGPFLFPLIRNSKTLIKTLGRVNWSLRVVEASIHKTK